MRGHSFRSMAGSVFIVSALLLAACAGDGGEAADPEPTEDPTTADAAATDAESPTNAETPTDREPSTLTIAGLGGSTGELHAELFEPFEEEFNVTINWTSGASSENLAKVAAAAGNQEYDILIVDDLSAYTAYTEDLLEPLDPSIVTNLEDMHPRARTEGDYGVAHGYLATGLYYNTEVFEQNGWEPPTSWQDLFREEFCNEIAMANIAGSSTLKGIAMIGGLNEDGSNTDEAVRSGIEQLGEIGDCIPTFEANVSALSAKIQQTEGAAVGIAGSNRIAAARAEGFPVAFVIPEEGTSGTFTTVAIVKDGPGELQQEFVNRFLEPDIQLRIAEGAGFAPFNTQVEMPDELIDELGLPGRDAADSLLQLDLQQVVDLRPEWNALFDSTFAN